MPFVGFMSTSASTAASEEVAAAADATRKTPHNRPTKRSIAAPGTASLAFVPRAKRMQAQADDVKRLAQDEQRRHDDAKHRRHAYEAAVDEALRRHGPAAPPPPPPPPRTSDAAALASRYPPQQKRPKAKLGDRQRFEFDWDASEDTSAEANSLYGDKHEALLLFGRGKRGGIDPREQLEKCDEELQQRHRSFLQLRAASSSSSDAVDGPPATTPSTDAAVSRIDESRRLMHGRSRMAQRLERASLHYSDKTLDEMTERDWRIFREDHQIATRGNVRHPQSGQIIAPFRFWRESGLDERILEVVRRVGYSEPTGVQMMCIPLGVACKDVIGVARTGSGKTAAFVLPMLTYILKQPPITRETATDGPLALIMAPTRELVQQIEEEAHKFASELSVRIRSIVGGVSIEEQSFIAQQGVEVLIATPGRLCDVLERRYLVLNQCNYVVLDEADRMIDMGFEPQVNQILDAMPSSNLKPASEDVLITLDGEKRYRQTYMFSATMPPKVERMARTYLRQPAIVYIGDQSSSRDDIEQCVEVLKENAKYARLVQLLQSGPPPPVIVFCNEKRGCDHLSKALDKLGVQCAVIHSGKEQALRELAIDGFKSGEVDVLVATDIAARGIDVQGVEHVVNYDMPKDIETYTHRIGRTGRAGRKGVATTFVTGNATEEGVMWDLVCYLRANGAVVPAELSRHPAAQPPEGQRRRGKGGGAHRRDVIAALGVRE